MSLCLKPQGKFMLAEKNCKTEPKFFGSAQNWF